MGGHIIPAHGESTGGRFRGGGVTAAAVRPDRIYVRTKPGQDMRDTDSGGYERRIWAIAAVLAGLILAVDLTIPLGVAGGVPYMALVLLGWWFESRRNIIVLAATSTLFTIVGYFLSPEGVADWIVVTNRFLALAAIWFTAALLFKAKETQMALRAAHRLAQESEARYAGIIDIALEAIITADSDGRIKLFNQGAEAIFGYRAAEIIGQPIETLMPGRFKSHHGKLFQDFANSPDASRRMGQWGEIAGIRKDGGEFPAEASVSKLTLRNERIFTVVLRDATARKRAEEAVASRTKFFAAASHDLRQPLHAISLYLPVLEEDAESDRSRQMTKAIGNACESMNMLLDSLLEISRLDAGVIEPRIDAVSLADVFDQLATEFKPQAEARSLELRVVPASGWVNTDIALLWPILRNLLSNAIRYTPKGRILLGVRRRGDKVALEVWDTGVGIAANQHERIFEEFHQLDNPERDRNKGLGLGLAIVRRLATLLDHPLELHSREGRGTVFRLELPLTDEPAADAAGDEAATAFPDMAGLLAVLVEDDAEILEATKFMLNRWRCDVIVAESVADATARVEAAGRAPDFVLADLRLRGSETGVQAIEAVRNAVGEPVPGLIVTGDTDPQRLRQVAESDYTLLHKPVSAAKLRMAIEVLLAGRAAEVARNAAV